MVSTPTSNNKMSSTYQCHKSCECENKSENWNVCHECGDNLCDFAKSDHGWEYLADERWICRNCVAEEKCYFCNARGCDARMDSGDAYHESCYEPEGEQAPKNGECDKCHKPLTGADNNKWGSEHGEYKSLCDLCLDEEEDRPSPYIMGAKETERVSRVGMWSEEEKQEFFEEKCRDCWRLYCHARDADGNPYHAMGCPDGECHNCSKVLTDADNEGWGYEYEGDEVCHDCLKELRAENGEDEEED